MVTRLFTYDGQGNATSHQSVNVSLEGIEGNRRTHSLCQVLLMPPSSLSEFGLREMDLKENIILDIGSDLYSLPSGTVLRLGSAELRLTFHCEPCQKIKHIINPKKIIHQRGYLAKIVKAGRINVGDSVTIMKKRYDSIPYEKADRIKWYLDQQDEPVLVSKLIEEIGLSKSYCRAVPNIIRNRTDIDKSKIIYANKRRH